MKIKHLLGLVAVVGVAGFVAPAQAGWSVSFSFAAPVHFAPPVVVPAPCYPPPVVYCPPPVVYYPRPVVYCPPPVVVYRPVPPPCPPVVYVPPTPRPHYGHHDNRGYYNGQSGFGRDGSQYSRVGYR